MLSDIELIPHELTQFDGLNVPFGARCFLTLDRAPNMGGVLDVLMHLLALGAF